MTTVEERVGPKQWRLLCAVEFEHPHPMVVALALINAGMLVTDDATYASLRGLVARGLIEHVDCPADHVPRVSCRVRCTEAGREARLKGANLLYAALQR